jgi:3-hydroxybutyrate dehydrogenase
MLSGKVALITGSTSGIGLSTAIGLAKAGSNIVLNGIASKEAVDKISHEIETDYKV